MESKIVKMKKIYKIIKLLGLSILIMFFTILNNTGETYFTVYDKYIFYGFPIIATIIYFIYIYKLSNTKNKIPKNKDNKTILIFKQIFNGTALSFFIMIAKNRMWPMEALGYNEIEDRITLMIIMIIISIVIVLFNKNINNYLKLITYSQSIIIPLMFICNYILNIANPPMDMYRNYFWANIENAITYLIRILNVVLPLKFYLEIYKQKWF